MLRITLALILLAGFKPIERALGMGDPNLKQRNGSPPDD